MKKIILFFLVVVLLFGFSSCSKNQAARLKRPPRPVRLKQNSKNGLLESGLLKLCWKKIS